MRHAYQHPQLLSLFEQIGIPACDAYNLPTSEKRFSDGAQYRIEIPSTEGPEGLKAVLDEAGHLNVPIQRVSQGSGVFMLTDEELDDYAVTAAAAGVEASLFARPNAGWVASAMSLTTSGRGMAATARGQDQIVDCADDILRAASHGFRSVLISDIGVLWLFSEMRRAGLIPPTMQAKISVMLPAANPIAARVLVGLGANTLNLPTDLELTQIAAIRQAVDVPLDIYVEGPSDLGGFVRLHQIPELIRIAAPVYIKFGLRNGPDIYPTGQHLRQTALSMSRERVRRAKLALELLERSGFTPRSTTGTAADLAVPEPAQANGAIPAGTTTSN